MSSDESSGARPAAPIVLRIKLRYGDVDVMVQRFAANVGKSGLFLPTRSLQPLGAEIKFELRLADDTPALVGLGRVKSIRPPDPQQPRAVFGMGVELMRVTPQSRALILRMLEQRRVAGLPEVGLPTAEDIDAARRADGVEPGRDVVSGPMPMAPVIALHAPPAAIGSAEPAPSDGLLTSPRRTTGPIAVTKLAAVAPLSPEPPRRRRAAVDEIIARAAAPSASAPALPDLEARADVDVAAAVTRARALAGGALDAELAALSEAGSVPREISVEAASAELARQLGGSPVRRERTAGGSAPVAHGAPAAVEAPADDGAPVAAEVSADDGAPVAAEVSADDGAPVAAEVSAGDGAPAAAEVSADDGAPVAGGAALRPRAPVIAADPPAELAIDDRAATEVPVDDGGDAPGGGAGDGGSDDHGADDGDNDAADDGDNDVAIALAELDADEHTDLGGTPAPAFELPAEIDEPGIPDTGAVPTGEGAPGEGEAGQGSDDAGSIDPAGVEVSFQEFDDFEILAEADAEDPEVLAAVGALREVPELGDPDTAGEVSTPPPIQLDFAARLDLEEDHALYDAASPFEEVSDRHVIETLVEELTTRHPARRATGLRAAARLPSSGIRRGLHTDDDPFDDDADRGDDGRDAVQPIFEQEPSTSYTLAGLPLDSIDVDGPPPRRGPARLATVRPEPAMLRHPPLTLGGQADDHELEHALEALDVDLDDLASPHADTHLARDGSRAPPRQTHGGRSSAPPSAVIRPGSATRTPPQQLRPPTAGTTRTAVAAPAAARRTRTSRAPSDDGIDIDFDDDD